MMVTAKRAPEADKDLVRISTYIANDNPSAAFRWLDEMAEVCNLRVSGRLRALFWQVTMPPGICGRLQPDC